MTRRHRARGNGLVEMLVGTALGMLVLTGLAGAIAGGARVLVVTAARGELEDIAHIAVESLTFDVRRAGFDPTAAGVPAVVEAYTDRVTLTADLDGDGAVDADSEETIGYVCASATRRLSRVVGRQSMPVADGVTRCSFRYLDTTGTVLAVPTTGLATSDLARVRAIALDLAVAAPGLAMPTARAPLVGLRVPS